MDLVLGNEKDFNNCLGIGNKINNENSRGIDVLAYENFIDEIFRKFNNLKYAAMILMSSISASESK